MKGSKMKKELLIVLLIAASVNMAWAQTSPDAQVDQAQGTNEKPVLVRRIILSGFVLNETKKLNAIIKSYQNKHLYHQDIQQIIDQIKSLYLEAGYAQFTHVDYKLQKNRLLIDITMDQ